LKPTEADRFFDALPETTREFVRAIVDTANAQGVEIYSVGGPVRDWLLDRPVRDVDLIVVGEAGEATEAEDGGDDASDASNSLRVSRLLEASMPDGARVTRHDRFGVYLLRSGEVAVDLAQCRRESYAYPGALPRVAPGTLEQDLKRRDFSVNAIALPLSQAALAKHPRLVDVGGGLADLQRKQLRVLHERSFHDDPTRVVRAARLAARLDFSLARNSRSALRSALRDGAFGRVSGDRLRREWTKLIDDAEIGVDPSRSLRLLSDWHVLAVLEPGLALPRAAVAPLRRLGRTIADPPWRASRWRPWVSAMAVWLAGVEPALRRRTLARFSVRGEAARRILAFPKSRDGWLRSLAKARGRGAIDAVLAPLSDEDLHALHACAEPTARRRIMRWATEDRLRRIPLTGEELLEIGLEGPVVGRALVRLRTACLDGRVTNRDEAIALAREIGRRTPPKRKRSASAKKRPTKKASRSKSSKKPRRPRGDKPRG